MQDSDTSLWIKQSQDPRQALLKIHNFIYFSTDVS